MLFKPSYYNLIVSHQGNQLLYNGVSSALIQLSDAKYQELAGFLGPIRDRTAGVGLDDWNCPTFSIEDLPGWARKQFEPFLDGSFFVPADVDEQATLKQRYEFCRANSPLMVTITTTMDCNFGCYYCYEDKSKVSLSRAGCDAILDWITDKVRKNGHEKIFIDWYGGEPMLNQDAINYFSEKAIAFAEHEGIGYTASIISNGTLWPDDPSEFISKNRIRHLQITIDGPEPHHNKRRRFTDGREETDSFHTVMDTVDKLIGNVKTYLRINVDPWIGRSALDLVEEFDRRGWLEPGSKFLPYLASIGPMTEQCGFLGKSSTVEEFQQEFEDMKHEFHQALMARLGTYGMDHLQYYPQTVSVNCAAMNENSVVFGPDGRMYKCGLEVGDNARSHGALPIVETSKPDQAEKRVMAGALPVISEAVATLPDDSSTLAQYAPDRWEKFDPFSHDRCSQCQYLPVCMGGCPKSQIDKNEYYLRRQSEYWENGFDRIIRNYFEATRTRY